MADALNLTSEDVAKLRTDSSTSARIDTARKVAGQLAGTLTDAERKLAEDIVRAFLQDAETRVRAALADTLKTCPAVPQDVALGLARDVAEVAVPFVQFSQGLSDADLIAIIAENGLPAQIAVAQRSTVSEPVSEALVRQGGEDAVAALVGNTGARISDSTFGEIAERHGGSSKVAQALAVRPKVPVAIAERMVHNMFDHLWNSLAQRQNLPNDLVSDLVLQAREKATIALFSAEAPRYSVEALIAHLQAHKRLTPSIILRALCMGDMPFLEASLASLARIPLENVRRLIEDEGGAGLNRLLQACGVPDALLGAFRTAIAIVKETGYDGGPNDRERYRSRVTERILTTGEPDEDLMPGSDLDYLISRLAKSS
jgi:uncharacterized protein (DUF2336 family)